MVESSSLGSRLVPSLDIIATLQEDTCWVKFWANSVHNKIGAPFGKRNMIQQHLPAHYP